MKPQPSTAQIDISTATRLQVLWSFARPYRHTLATGLLLSLAVSAMALATPLVTQWVLDTVGVGGSLRDPALVLVGLLIVGAVLGWLQWVMLGALAESVVYDARRQMIERYLGARVFELLVRGPGQLVTRVTSDTLLLKEAASSSVIGLINGSVMLIGSLILMGYLDSTLLGTTLAAVVFVVLVFTILMPRISRFEEKAQASLGDLGDELEGTLRAIKTVKSAAAEPRRHLRLMHHVGESRRWGVKSVRVQAAAWTAAGVATEGAVIMVLAFGAYRVSTGAMAVSTLVAFLLYVWGLSGPVMELTENLTTLQSGLAAAGRINEIQRLPTESEGRTRLESTTDDAHHDLPSPDVHLEPVASGHRKGDEIAPAAIHFSAVAAGYGDGSTRPAVRDVELSIPSRGHIAVVGPSGAGKTTILSLAMRLLEPASGCLSLFGVPYSRLTHDQVRAAFAYVEQETPTVPGTLRDNLLLINPDATDQRITEVLDQLDLSAKVAALPEGLDALVTQTNLSGGQRQRLALARALLSDRRILLLDEATAQVDGITEAAISRAISAYSQHGVVVTVAHRISTVIDADLIVVMKDGEIVERGSHEDLMRNDGLYLKLVKALRIAEK
nr:ABC transporter ATP-binding protein [Rhodococcus sp. (in: high G+C Gram-positive bacteria)]